MTAITITTIICATVLAIVLSVLGAQHRTARRKDEAMAFALVDLSHQWAPLISRMIGRPPVWDGEDPIPDELDDDRTPIDPQPTGDSPT